MSVRRKLPSHSNPLLAEDIPSFDELVDMRRLGQTKLYNSKANADSTVLMFSYVHLRAPLPTDINPEIFGSGSGSKPEAYFLMRRSKDGFVSSTGMFKASFPMATKSEEDLERRYVKATYHTSPEETAGNVWIHPEDAVTLSSDYNCRVWIEALVDDRVVLQDNKNRNVTPPPTYKVTNSVAQGDSAASSITAALRQSDRTRSASPTKKRRGGRASKHPPKEASSLKRESSVAQSDSADGATTNAAASDEKARSSSSALRDPKLTRKGARSALKVGLSGNGDVVKSESTAGDVTADEDSAFTVEVEKSTETKGDIKVESTHVKVEIATSEHPTGIESPEEMIAKAKEMVAEAMKVDVDTQPTRSKSKKRKVEEMNEAAENGEAAEANGNSDENLRAKRTKTWEGAITEKVRKRAMIGLGATIAIGVTSVALPYLL